MMGPRKPPVSLLSAALLLSIGLPAAVRAAENGNIQYSPGSSQFFAGATPPYPGLYLASHTSVYRADELTDGRGNKLPVDFKVKGLFETLRLVGVTDTKILGGTLWGQLVVPVALDLDTRVGGFSDSRRGAGDVVFGTALAWFRDRNTYIVGLDVGLPTGRYDATRLANPGNNYWSLQPVLGYHYLDPQGWEFGTTFRYIFSTQNRDTDYTTGQQIVVDYAAGYHIGRSRIGAVGYVLKQTTDDKVAGSNNNGNRVQGVGIGPSYTFAFSPATQVSVAYMKEYKAENRSQGDSVWLHLTAKLK